ncbi:MAG: hypothetical protein ACFFD4_16150 [Candidatus Odinarchaeota archaeon]
MIPFSPLDIKLLVNGRQSLKVSTIKTIIRNVMSKFKLLYSKIATISLRMMDVTLCI